MASKNIGQVSPTPGAVAVQVLAANPQRQSLALRIFGRVLIGTDNTVNATNGYPIFEKDGPLVDEIPATDAVYAYVPTGASGTVCFLEVSS